jgi:hypothetical protein
MLEWPSFKLAGYAGYIAAGTAIGLVLGGLWQFFFRSDVANRLILISVVAPLVGFLVPIADNLEYRPAAVHAVIALVSGVVIAEQWHRIRERRRTWRGTEDGGQQGS